MSHDFLHVAIIAFKILRPILSNFLWVNTFAATLLLLIPTSGTPTVFLLIPTNQNSVINACLPQFSY